MSVPVLFFPSDVAKGDMIPYTNVNGSANMPGVDYFLKHPIAHLMLYLKMITMEEIRKPDVSLYDIFDRVLTPKIHDPIIDAWKSGVYVHSINNPYKKPQQIVLQLGRRDERSDSYEMAVNHKDVGLITLPVYLIVHSDLPCPPSKTELIVGPLITGHVAKYRLQYSYNQVLPGNDDGKYSYWNTWKRIDE